MNIRHVIYPESMKPWLAKWVLQLFPWENPCAFRHRAWRDGKSVWGDPAFHAKHLCKTDFPFAHLSSRLVIKYRDTLLEAGVGKNTIGFYLHNMKAVYRRGCLELNLVFPSPFAISESGLKRPSNKVFLWSRWSLLPTCHFQSEHRNAWPEMFLCSVSILAECHS